MRLCRGCNCRLCGSDEESVEYEVNHPMFYGRIKTILMNYGLSEISSSKAILELTPLIAKHLEEHVDFLTSDYL